MQGRKWHVILICILIEISIFSFIHAEDFNQEIYAQRRHKLMESMNGGIAVFKNAGMYEYEIASIFSYVFEKNGSHAKAYESIVASGPNATIYHYSDVNRLIRKGDLVMMDMGAEFGYYASDITRVLPVSGKFTTQQKAVYEIVLEIEKAMAKMSYLNR